MNSVIDSWEMDPPRGNPQPSSTKPTSNVVAEDSDDEEVDCRRPLVKEITEEGLQNLSNSLVVLSGDDEVSEYEEVPEEEVRGDRPLLYKAITPEMAFKAAQRIEVLTEYSEILEPNTATTASTSRRISHQSTGTGGSRSSCASTIRISDQKESSRKGIQLIIAGSHEQMKTQKSSSNNKNINETKGLKAHKNEGSGEKSASSKSKRSSTGRTTGDALVKESKAKNLLDRKRKSSSHESKESTALSGSKHRPRRSCTITSSAEEKDQHDSDSSRSRSPPRKKRPNAPKSSRRQSATKKVKSSTGGQFSRTTKKATSEEIAANDAVPECQTVVTMMDTPESTPCGIKTGIVCQNKSAIEYPCRRCHREYYCSVEHQIADANRHKPLCKIDAQLELIPFNKVYSSWLKHNAPFLYKKCLNFVLVWPSLTVEWLTDEVNGSQLLLGTNTGDSEPNHLLICGVDAKKNKKFAGEFQVLKRITHRGEINRARHMPQSNHIIATKSPSKDVFVFITNNFPEIAQDDVFHASLVLRGHTNGGFGLAWNANQHGILASGSDDGAVCIWDINAKPVTTSIEERVSPGALDAYTKHSEHTSVVEDVGWSSFDPHLLASCGDDKKLILWDTRTKTSAQTKENAHDGDINSVSLSPFSEFLVLTGGSDKIVKVWDTRRFDDPQHTIQPFKDEVMHVQFSPLNAMNFASAGNDGKVYIMDITRSSASSSTESDEVSVPKECEFVHMGHVSAINDISWNSSGVMASVSGDNILQVWEPAEPEKVTFGERKYST